jgi:hypothetical protein
LGIEFIINANGFWGPVQLSARKTKSAKFQKRQVGSSPKDPLLGICDALPKGDHADLQRYLKGRFRDGFTDRKKNALFQGVPGTGMIS